MPSSSRRELVHRRAEARGHQWAHDRPGTGVAAARGRVWPAKGRTTIDKGWHGWQASVRDEEDDIKKEQSIVFV